jgi:hypothetical protein
MILVFKFLKTLYKIKIKMPKVWYVHKIINKENYEPKDEIIYGIYENNKCVYVGKTYNLGRQEQKHKNSNEYINKNITIKEFKKGKCQKLNWEKVYTQWFSLKYKLNNTKNVLDDKVKLKKISNYYEFEDTYKNKFKYFYEYNYLYMNPYLGDIITSKSIERTLKKSINKLRDNNWKISL